MIQLFKLEIHDDNHSSLSLKYMLFWYYFITICWTRVFSAFVLAYFKTHSLSATLGCVLYVITQMIKMWILWSQAWSHLWSQYSHYMWSHPCPQPVIKPDITRLITLVTTCKKFLRVITCVITVRDHKCDHSMITKYFYWGRL